MFNFEYVHGIIFPCGKLSYGVFKLYHFKLGLIFKGLEFTNGISIFNHEIVHLMSSNLWYVTDLPISNKYFKTKINNIFHKQSVSLIQPIWIHGHMDTKISSITEERLHVSNLKQANWEMWTGGTDFYPVAWITRFPNVQFIYIMLSVYVYQTA